MDPPQNPGISNKRFEDIVKSIIIFFVFWLTVLVGGIFMVSSIRAEHDRWIKAIMKENTENIKLLQDLPPKPFPILHFQLSDNGTEDMAGIVAKAMANGTLDLKKISGGLEVNIPLSLLEKIGFDQAVLDKMDNATVEKANNFIDANKFCIAQDMKMEVFHTVQDFEMDYVDKYIQVMEWFYPMITRTGEGRLPIQLVFNLRQGGSIRRECVGLGFGVINFYDFIESRAKNSTVVWIKKGHFFICCGAAMID